MDKGLQKLFKDVVNEISQALTSLGGSGSEVSYLIPEHRNFSEVTKLSEDIKKHWLKATLKEINNLINNKKNLVDEPEKGEPVTPCIDFINQKIQYDVSIDRLELIIVVREDLQNKDLIGYTWSPTASMRNLK